jgi:hypothetical protein
VNLLYSLGTKEGGITYMVKIKEWSDDEVERLRKLYTSNKTFDEIAQKFPLRTGNAIRLKASRLGIKRPIIDNIIQVNAYDKLVFTEFADYLKKCKECGSWIQVRDNPVKKNERYTCERCGKLNHL